MQNLSNIGISFALLGTILTYVCHDPYFSSNLTWGQKFKHEATIARTGLLLMVAGTVLQIWASAAQA